MQTDQAWIALAMMVSFAGLSLAIGTIHGKAYQSLVTIRVTVTNRPAAVLWTLAQTVIF